MLLDSIPQTSYLARHNYPQGTAMLQPYQLVTVVARIGSSISALVTDDKRTCET